MHTHAHTAKCLRLHFRPVSRECVSHKSEPCKCLAVAARVERSARAIERPASTYEHTRMHTDLHPYLDIMHVVVVVVIVRAALAAIKSAKAPHT